MAPKAGISVKIVAATGHLAQQDPTVDTSFRVSTCCLDATNMHSPLHAPTHYTGNFGSNTPAGTAGVQDSLFFVISRGVRIWQF